MKKKLFMLSMIAIFAVAGLVMTLAMHPSVYNVAAATAPTTASGGDIITRTTGDDPNYSGTIGINAMCNFTGRLGILTNEHVARTLDRNPPLLYHSYGNSNNFLGDANDPDARGRYRRVYIGSNDHTSREIDAAFVPFANPDEWNITPHARWGGIHRE